MTLPRIGEALNWLSVIWEGNQGLDRFRYLALGIGWQIRRSLGHSFVIRLHTGAMLSVHPTSAYSAAFYFRWIERKDLLFIRANCWLAPCFVDVGANVGLFSAFLFDKFRRFILIEPSPSSYAATLETCSLNSDIECEVMNLGLSDCSGELTFNDEGLHSTTSRFVNVSIETPKSMERVAVNTLDNILNSTGLDVIVKIDVEGWEEKVFQGSVAALADGRIRLVMFERLERTNLENIRRLLDRFDYTIFYVTEEGRPTRNPDAIERPLVNLFACPRMIYDGLKCVGTASDY